MEVLLYFILTNVKFNLLQKKNHAFIPPRIFGIKRQIFLGFFFYREQRVVPGNIVYRQVRSNTSEEICHARETPAPGQTTMVYTGERRALIEVKGIG